MGILSMQDMQGVAERVVDVIRGKGGAAVVYADYVTENGQKTVGNLFSILHAREVGEDVDCDLDEAQARAEDVCRTLHQDDLKFKLSRVPVFAWSIEDAGKKHGVLVVSICAKESIDFSLCIAKICDRITATFRDQNKKDGDLMLGFYRVYGGFHDENGAESIYFKFYNPEEVRVRITADTTHPVR